MILIDGTKYSCLECVRGHRSSLCRHHMRPLLQVRSKGRPNFVLSTGNKNHRIAVFAEEIASSPEPEGKKCAKLPVVILKASDKHIIDLSNGQIVGPYNEEEQKSRISKPVIKSESFVYSSSCCSQGITKSRKLCSCNQAKVSKSRILSTYLSKKLQAQILNGNTANKSLCCSKKNQPVVKLCCPEKKTPPPTIKKEGSCCGAKKEKNSPQAESVLQAKNTPQERNTPQQQFTFDSQYFNSVDFNEPTDSSSVGNESSFESLAERSQHTAGIFTSESGKEIFEVIDVPSCSIPGSCCCSSDCQCPDCEVHNNGGQISQNLEFLNNDAQFASNLILTQSKQNPLQFPTLQNSEASAFSGTIGAQNYSQMAAPKTDLLEQQHQPVQQSQQIQTSSYLQQTFSRQASGFERIQLLGFRETDPYSALLQQILDSESTPHTGTSSLTSGEMSLCTCADDSCFCDNCETHGIIEGYKLDDIFSGGVPLDLSVKIDAQT